MKLDSISDYAKFPKILNAKIALHFTMPRSVWKMSKKDANAYNVTGSDQKETRININKTDDREVPVFAENTGMSSKESSSDTASVEQEIRYDLVI